MQVVMFNMRKLTTGLDRKKRTRKHYKNFEFRLYFCTFSGLFKITIKISMRHIPLSTIRFGIEIRITQRRINQMALVDWKAHAHKHSAHSIHVERTIKCGFSGHNSQKRTLNVQRAYPRLACLSRHCKKNIRYDLFFQEIRFESRETHVLHIITARHFAFFPSSQPLHEHSSLALS